MSGRPTADIVADLYGDVHTACENANPCAVCQHEIEAADRLTELDAALPTCPVCGGTGSLGDRHDGLPCPDCDATGKVTVAQMAALWQAVHHEPAYEVLQSHDAVSLLVDLRHAHEVRP